MNPDVLRKPTHIAMSGGSGSPNNPKTNNSFDDKGEHRCPKCRRIVYNVVRRCPYCGYSPKNKLSEDLSDVINKWIKKEAELKD